MDESKQSKNKFFEIRFEIQFMKAVYLESV